jgi:hypothetical protein
MKKCEVMGCVKDIGDLHTKVWWESMKGRHQFDTVDTDGW